MLQMQDMMNMQKMGWIQAMQVPLANMKQQGIMQKMQLADMARENGDQKMEILEMAKELAMLKQEMLEYKHEEKSRKLERLQGGKAAGAKKSQSPDSPDDHEGLSHADIGGF